MSRFKLADLARRLWYWCAWWWVPRVDMTERERRYRWAKAGWL